MQNSPKSDNRRGQQQNKSSRPYPQKNQEDKRPRVEHTRKSASSILTRVFHAIKLDQKASPRRWGLVERTSLNEMKKTAAWLLAEGKYTEAAERAIDTAERFKVRFKLEGEPSAAVAIDADSPQV